MQLPDHDLPDWLRSAAMLLAGAGGAKMLAVWLENRRLGRQDYRETLLERVRELETVVSGLQTRVANLRVEVAHLEEENVRLREELEECRVHRPLRGGGDASAPERPPRPV